jgi:ribose transport system ATP-binding protein
VSKRFDGTPVLRSADLDLVSGEVHALIGQNGSGKSTLIKILAGYLQPEPGARAWLDGDEMQLGAPSPGERQRLHFIHQSLNLIPNLSVLDNAALGLGYPTRWGRINWAVHRRRTAELMRRLAVDVDLDRPADALSAVEQTILVIARAVNQWTSSRSILVLDEPTAALPQVEVHRLFETVRRVAAEGAAVLFVTHRLAEVFTLAQRVTVLREGQVVASGRSLVDLDEPSLVELMLGRRLEELTPPTHSASGDVVCSVRNLSSRRLRGLSLDMRRGEIVGVAGLDGSGREELADVIFGAKSRTGGSVSIAGREVAATPAAAIAAGIGLVPADRLQKACVPQLSVTENVTLPSLAPLTRWWHALDKRRERREVSELMQTVALDPPNIDRSISSFSGGNQQKAVLGKWLRAEPAVLLLDEPGQGVDVSAKASIFRLISAAARRGMAVLVCSAVAEDLELLCDRVIVIRHGIAASELAGTVSAPQITAEVLRNDRTATLGPRVVEPR